MTGRERVQRTLTFTNPDRVPRNLWTLPGVELFRAIELQKMRSEFPEDFSGPGLKYGPALKASGVPGRKGRYVDAWGCIWEAKEEGVTGEVKDPILGDWENLSTLTPPMEILDTDWNVIDGARERTSNFILAGTTIRPFERMQFLRGSENLYMDMAYGTAEFHKLKSLVHEFYLYELEHFVNRDVDGISFMDDWGAQHALLISPAMWRELFKPLYKEYCDLAHSRGKFVFMHSDGYISDIIPDLIEIGVDALNSQLFCMNIEDLGQKFRGKITFWGEIDRQHLLPFGSVEQVKEGVRRVKRALGDQSGGLIAQCEWGNIDPFENIQAVFEAWEENDRPS